MTSSSTPSYLLKSLSRSRMARMHDVMRQHVAPGEVPGLVFLLRHRDREFFEAVGTMAFDSDVPMRRNTIFRLASMTKPVTAAAAMILVEECRLRLDDAIDGWLPELASPRVLRAIDGPLDDTVPAKRAITVRDLLTFRCGYGEVEFVAPGCPLHRRMMELQLPLSAWPFAGTTEDFLTRLGSLPLAHQPGERWLYHMGSEILGVLIARVSDMPLSRFLGERLFEPLGMIDTGFHVPPDKIERVPTCYGRQFPDSALVVLDSALGGQVARPPLFESGGGGLVSTADDLLAFGRMMLKRGTYGGERILSRSSVELMTSDQITPGQKAASPFFENFWETRGWGLGLSVVTRRQDVADAPGRFGWDGAFGTSWHVDPQTGLVGILLTQRRPDVLALPPVIRDFWTCAYSVLDD